MTIWWLDLSRSLAWRTELLAFLGGCFCGLAYFTALRWQAHAMVLARLGLPAAMFATVLRLAVLAACLLPVVRLGAVALVAVVLGLRTGRGIVLRQVGNTPPAAGRDKLNGLQRR